MKGEGFAIKFIQMVSRATDKPLYAGNSGGKDSAVLDHLLQRSGITYHSFYANTTIDPPGTIGHIREFYPHTEILQPKLSFYQLVEKKGLPTRLNRYCCERLKEYGSIGRVVFEGVRSAEGTNRQGRDYIQCDSRKSQKGAQHIYPIYDWSTEEVLEYVAKYGIKLAPSYDLGLKRLGCVGCPLVRKKGVREKEFEMFPRYYNQIKKSIGIGMKNNPQWWLSSRTMEEYFITDKKK